MYMVENAWRGGDNRFQERGGGYCIEGYFQWVRYSQMATNRSLDDS